MNTPNNAAAEIDRLIAECAGYEQHRRMTNFWRPAFAAIRHDLTKLRATLAQPDALTSQPSGESDGLVGYMDPNADFMLPRPNDCVLSSQILLTRHKTIRNTMPLFTHPSADAPGVAVGEAMATRAIFARNEYLNRHPGEALGAMHAALTAALAPKPEGGQS